MRSYLLEMTERTLTSEPVGLQVGLWSTANRRHRIDDSHIVRVQRRRPWVRTCRALGLIDACCQ